MKHIIVFLIMFLTAGIANAHRTVRCDGSETIIIRAPHGGMVQIKTSEEITGVYPVKPQNPGLIQYDQANPKHLFRVNAALLDEASNIHINTLNHVCIARIWRVYKNRDSLVNIQFPPPVTAALPASEQQSPVRSIWYAIWESDKQNAPGVVKVEERDAAIPSFIQGLDMRMKWRYSIPGYVGYTLQAHNITDQALWINPSALTDASQPLHSIILMNRDNTAPLDESGKVEAGDIAWISVIYWETE